MNHGKILSRAWTLLWQARALWLFGFLFVLAGGGGFQARSGFNGGGSGTGRTGTGTFPTIPFSQINWGTVAWIVAGVLALLLVVAVVAGIVRYLAETALMAGANEIESTGAALTVRHGFRLGWSRQAWRLFLTDLVIHLPLAIVSLVLLAAGAAPLLLWLAHQVPLGILGTLVTVGLELLFILMLLAVNLVLSVIMPYLRRRVVLDKQGPLAALRQSARLVRASLVDTGLMWLLLAGIRIVWSLVMIPVFILLFVLAAIIGGVPAGVVYMLSHSIAWTAAVGVPLFLLVIVPIGGFISGLFETYVSTSWTLTYREAISKFGDQLVPQT